MKRIILLVLTLAIFTTFIACSRSTPLVQQDTSSNENITSSKPIKTTAKITFPEGMTLVEIAKKLEENEVCSAADFVNTSKDVNYFKETYSYSFLDSIDQAQAAFPLEGYIFPDTYEFYIGEEVHSVINRFLSNFNTKFSQDLRDLASQKGFSINEIVILASIIQDECSYPNEMSNVSAVFVNRIHNPAYKRLQSDVTINYVNKYITNSPYNLDETIDYAALYNTYKCFGLPVSAVCCPGIDAIKAAINPSDNNYYFFVTDADMNYYYATTYEEHLVNCKKCGY